MQERATMIEQTVATCPECGAVQVDGMTCWEQLGALLGWESQDPELQAAHFLTVAAYNLQHPAQFTSGAWPGLRTSFIARLEQGTAVEDWQRQAARASAGQTRVLRNEVNRMPVRRSWSITIADVYRPDRPAGAAARVRAWAACIRQEL
ncbi:MAG TPA: DUF5946 family protein [Chloroflexia bacterium]|nr:DUF5946 family protein [Chloroflexia bacterium]